MKYTKGPWKVNERSVTVWDELGNFEIPFTLADARLIAAAPDIYEALNRAKIIIESEDTHYVGQDTRNAAMECLAMINDAIYKAEGK